MEKGEYVGDNGLRTRGKKLWYQMYSSESIVGKEDGCDELETCW